MERFISRLANVALSLNRRRKRGDAFPFDFLALGVIYRLLAILPFPIRITVNGATISYRFPTANAAAAGIHILATERPLLRDVMIAVESSDVFYDIGANVGIFAAAVQGKTYAFEPIPANIMALLQNLYSSDSRLIGVALSNQPGLMWVNETDVREGSPTAALRKEDGGIGLARMELDGIDLPPPSVVKIDVEGAELAVLRGATETFSKESCRRLYVEVHEGEGVAYDKVESILSDCGFSSFEVIDKRGDERFVRAMK
ncbi:FkbM family methyltransferase [Halobaculum sp. CBA1158]|uniref:FkbM family methyltransferase n=1 Tax=Halobaculum sp. CBA1158 TaxID=2904243 RepID=UPI001F02E75D|nr:FkbM family methyltransferase [Halobaculum sp. CBA1158]UIP00996.1 FkbM family methyltransferase [Halobaculum sp. CBA1158]